MIVSNGRRTGLVDSIDDSVGQRVCFSDTFSFIGTFRVKKPGKSGVALFTIMNVHLKPKKAFVELLAVSYVIEDFILVTSSIFQLSFQHTK